MSISKSLRQRIHEHSNNQCGYCHIQARYVHAPMEIDHILPEAAGGTDEETNLWLACPRCNIFKSDQTHAVDPLTSERVRLFNPRTEKWNDHFVWNENGTRLIGKTPCGRATIVALQINIDAAVEFRRLLVSVGWHPPKTDL